MAQEETAPHFDKITRALGDKVGSEISEAELKEQFDKFLQYGVDPEHAVRSLIRQYGGQGGTGNASSANPPPASADGSVKVVDLQPGLSSVDLLVRIVHVAEREINVRGEARTITTGILGDDTGTVPFTSWDPFEVTVQGTTRPVEKGDVVLLKEAYTKEFNNETQVNLGNRVQVELQAPDALPEYEPQTVAKPIGELEPGIGRCIVTGRVINLEKRTVMARGEEKTITTGVLADDSGQVPFTAWSDLDLNEGEVVCVDSGYVKAYRGVPQFNFDDAATIEKLADDALPPAEKLAQTEPVPLSTVLERGGGTNVTLRATLIEVRPGSGLVFRDPETNRVVQDHASSDQELRPDLRIKAILDDGTGAINAIIMRAETEALYGRSVKEAHELAKETMSWDIVEEELRTKVTGRAYEVTGNAVQDDFGMSFIVQRVQPISVDVPMRAAKLASKAQELLADLGDMPETPDEEVDA